MKQSFTKILTLSMVALFLPVLAFAQSSGDFRSAASGNWTAIATWEIFDGTNWAAASSAPTGSENITIYSTNTVTLDVSATITGYITVTDTAELEVADAVTLEFGNGSTYEHARDEGNIPVSTWSSGSTVMFTGTANSAPGNRGQDYFNVVLNTPNLASNSDLSLGGKTISGDITVVESGSARWRLIGGDSGTITIMGDLIVQGGSLETLGTGSPTEVIVNHFGNINVTGGTFAISRGSQANGIGSTTWNLLAGDFTMSNATSRNSNPTNAKFVFAAGGTQNVTFDNVDFEGNSINYDVSDSTTLNVGDAVSEVDFLVTGTLTNYGEITTTGVIAMDGDGTYNHARDGGDIPDITWMEGSTAMLTGIVGSAPGNRGQDYYNLVINTPNSSGNKDLDLVDNTIGGDIHVMNSGGSRWRLVGGDNSTITINGDVIIDEGASLETMGSGSVVDIVVNHYGDIWANGGVFAITRGSQGDGTEEGTGSTTWYLHEGDFYIDSAQTRNSISLQGNAKFVFASDTLQTLWIGANADIDELPIEIAGTTTLDLNTSIVEGDDIFVVKDGASVSTQNPSGLSPHFGSSVVLNFEKGAGIVFNGEIEQTSNIQGVADSLGFVRVENEAGFTFDDSIYTSKLYIEKAVTATIDTVAYVLNGGGWVNGTVINHGSVEVDVDSEIAFGDGSVYEHARDGGVIPAGSWGEGSSMVITGTRLEAPDGGDQDFYDVTFNTPNNNTNNYLGMVNKTISGDVHTVTTGAGRWYLSGGVSPGDTSRVWVLGDIIHEEGNFSVHGTGTADSHYEVYVNGDITVTGGNFSVSRGSQGNGTGSTNWFLKGDFSMSDATCQNSNSDNANWVFVNTEEPSLLTLNNVTINGSGMQVIVADSALLDLGNSEIDSGGDFTTEIGSTIYTANEGGLDSTFQISGSLSLSSQANFGFNGTLPQVTSFKLPLSVNGLIIDNPTGVLQSRDITINGFLRLERGIFDNSLGLMFGDNAGVIYGEGSLLIPLGTLPIPQPPFEIGDILNYNGSFALSETGDNAPDAWTINIAGETESTTTVTSESQDGDGKGLEMKIEWNESLNFYDTESLNEPIYVQEGERYRASIWIKSDTDSRVAQFYGGQPESGGWARIRGNPTPQLSLTTEWVEHSFEFTATASQQETSIRIGLEVNAEENDGGTIWIDNAKIEKIQATSTEVDDKPLVFKLNQNYPNPFNPSTNISYEIPDVSEVSIKIFDVMGRQVADLVNERQSPGSYTVKWNASGLASGMYLYKITAGSFIATKKLTLIK